MHVQQTKCWRCEKCEKEGKAYALRWMSLKMRACFWTAQNVRIWSFIKTTTRLYSSLSTRLLNHTALWLHLCSVFSVFAPGSSSFFLASITTFAIWRRDNETANTATALRKIKLCMCIQLFGAFLSVTNCIPVAWHYTPPTKNTHCKISSLTLRRLAIIGASLSEPHTSVTALAEVVCMYVCLGPYTCRKL